MDFGHLFNTYGTIIIEFLFELYLLYFLITSKLKRKEDFKFRLIISTVILLLSSFVISIFYYFYGDTVLGRVVVYTSLFVLSVIQLKVIFDESVWTIVLCATLGYSIQNLLYKTYLTLYTTLEWFKIFDYLEQFMLFDVFYRIFYYSIFGLLVFFIYKICISKLNSRVSGSHLKYQLLKVGLVVLCVTTVLCSIEDIFFAMIKSGRENDFDEFIFFVLRQTGNIFSIICCSIVIVLIHQALEKDDLKQKVEYLQHTIRAAERQYEISKDTIDMINIKCHDIKYKIEAHLNSKKSNDLNEINELIAIYDSKIETGNELLNVLFTEKSLYCEQNDIKFSAMIDGTKLDFIQDGDLYCIFGNLMDNALEAVTKINNTEKRIINITVKSKDNLLIIQQDNYFDGNIKFDNDGLPITSKIDKNYHGFGIQSIKLLVEKYHGTMTTYTSQDVFHLNILFNVNNLNMQNK